MVFLPLFIRIIILLFLTVSPSIAADFPGRVVSVKDGDTIEVLHNRTPERIRLAGIDCFEKKQAFGQRAKQATSALSFGQQVTIQSMGKERYGRTLGNVVISEDSTMS